tara:strand:- start:173 stop:673 length:501 start_codon:yes stop_codon:yes gene_type:complete
MRIFELFEDPGDPEEPTPRDYDDDGFPTPHSLKRTEREMNRDIREMPWRLKKLGWKAKAAGFVKPDGTPDTTAYLRKQSDDKVNTARWADDMYWKDNPTGKWKNTQVPTGNPKIPVISQNELIDPPTQWDPEDRKRQNKKIDDVMNQRTKTWKARNQLKRSGPDFT